MLHSLSKGRIFNLRGIVSADFRFLLFCSCLLGVFLLRLLHAINSAREAATGQKWHQLHLARIYPEPLPDAAPLPLPCPLIGLCTHTLTDSTRRDSPRWRNAISVANDSDDAVCLPLPSSPSSSSSPASLCASWRFANFEPNDKQQTTRALSSLPGWRCGESCCVRRVQRGAAKGEWQHWQAHVWQTGYAL